MDKAATLHNGAPLSDWRLQYAREAVSDIYTFAAVSLQPHDAACVSDEQLQAACLARIVQLAETAMSALSDDTETRAGLHRKLTGLALASEETSEEVQHG